MTAPSPRSSAFLTSPFTGDRRNSDQQLRRKLVAHLRRNELAEVGAIVRTAVLSRCSRHPMAAIRKAFSRVDRSSLLLDLLLTTDPGELCLAPIAEALLLGLALKRQAEVEQWLGGIRAVGWHSDDYIKNIVPRHHTLGPVLRNLKYPDLPDFRSGSDLIAYAETISHRITIDQGLLDVLYRSSRFASLPRNIWEQYVRSAFCIDHLAGDTKPALGWHALIDSNVASRELAGLDMSKGTLLMIFHGGFTPLTIAFAKKQFADLVVVTNDLAATRPSGRERVLTQRDTRSSLFVMFRALQDRLPVLMAADAEVGASHSSIDTLGVSSQVADGAAFLAYETRCNAVWCKVTREDDRLVAHAVPAPQPRAPEAYKDFKRRFFNFYAEQIESLLTGDPANIALKNRWIRILQS